MGREIVFGLPDQLPPVERDDERAGGSNTKPTAKRREEVQREYRQRQAKSAAAAVSGIKGDTLSLFPRQGGFGRSPPVASPRAKGIDTVRKEHTRSNNTEREVWMRNSRTHRL
jgi:hypothetical protein